MRDHHEYLKFEKDFGEVSRNATGFTLILQFTSPKVYHMPS